MAEAAVVHAIQRLLAQRRAYFFNLHGSSFGRNGLPDIVAIYRGVPVLIEAKSATGRLRPLQRHELERASRAGARTCVARSAHDVRAVLDQIDTELDGQMEAA